MDARWMPVHGKLIFTIRADRFLRNMVRALVGTMVDVGRGRISQEDFTGILKGKDRSLAGYSAPAKGLSLVDVEYPDGVRV
jgi:tRNA pseudouridine38-40 synthase